MRLLARIFALAATGSGMPSNSIADSLIVPGDRPISPPSTPMMNDKHSSSTASHTVKSDGSPKSERIITARLGGNRYVPE